MDRDILEALIRAPGPPGQEGAVRDVLTGLLDRRGIAHRTDSKGNVLVGSDAPRVVVTAHLDELALMVIGFEGAGCARVSPLGGVHPYKWGERAVEILAAEGGARTPGVLSFGGIHTASDSGAIGRHRAGQSVRWDDARVRFFDGDPQIGDRVVLAPHERTLVPLGAGKIAAPFLDDRADLAAWLKAIERHPGGSVLFVASVSEETGGEGALWTLGKVRPEVCVALELAPLVPDAEVALSPDPVLWVKDGYAITCAADIALVRRAARNAGVALQCAAYSRGGSDASIAQAQGLCARGITLGFPCENSHGLEIMDIGAIDALAHLTTALLKELS